MRKLPPLKALQVFETVALHLNMTHAANYLCLTQAAVSRQIQLLEAYFGFPLFQRHARGLTLTAEGQLLLSATSSSFDRIEEITTRLRRQRVALAIKVPTCVMSWIYPAIMAFQAEHPDIPLEVTTALQNNIDFQREPFDAAIAYGLPEGVNIHAELLFTEQLTPVCSPTLLKNRPALTEDDLRHMTLLHPSRDHRDWESWVRYAGFQAINIMGGQSFDTLDLAVSAAIQGYGVAIGDCTLAGKDLAAQRLVKPFQSIMPGQGYYFAYPETSANQKKLAVLHGWLSRYCAEGVHSAM